MSECYPPWKVGKQRLIAHGLSRINDNDLIKDFVAHEGEAEEISKIAVCVWERCANEDPSSGFN